MFALPTVTVLAMFPRTLMFSVLAVGEVVTTGGAITSIVSSLVANSPSASVSFTVIGKLPATVGVPEIAPVSGFMLNPAGSEPDAIDQAPVAGIGADPAVLV